MSVFEKAGERNRQSDREIERQEQLGGREIGERRGKEAEDCKAVVFEFCGPTLTQIVLADNEIYL